MVRLKHSHRNKVLQLYRYIRMVGKEESNCISRAHRKVSNRLL
jgi:hypothetical protein